MGEIVVVGLGPAGPELLTAGAVEVIAAIDQRYLRTARHPAASAVPGAATFDHLYDTLDTFDEVYRAIAEELVTAATEHERVLYAVPGSPRVLEHTVERLLSDDRVDLTVLPALSFLDLAWVRLGIDPVEAGVRLVDGHTFATAAAGERGPLLVAHCHNQRVLSDIKLAADQPGDTPVTVIQRLGLPDESITEVTWADLDRDVEADHLTSLYIAEMAAPVGVELVRFAGLVQRLREECPWDREQTHASLRRHLIEEAYETLDAIDGFDPESGDGAEDLEEELGDVLFQVFLHAAIAGQEGWFDLSDVARTVHDKLRDRHPHVFGDHEVSGTDQLVTEWEARKLVEKGRGSVMDGVATQLPALSLAEKSLKKAGAIGAPGAEAAAAELGAHLQAVTEDPSDDTVGRALLALVGLARVEGIDPEMALRAHAGALGQRVRRYEQLLAEAGGSRPETDTATLWEQTRP